MKKYNPMFEVRKLKDMGNFYKNPSVIIGIIALALIILGCFIPMYIQKSGVGVTIDNLLHSNFKSIVLIITIASLAIAFICVLFSVLFENSPKLSGLVMFMGGLILIGAIIQLIYCTKIGYPATSGNSSVIETQENSGTIVAVFDMYFGGFAVVLASLLIIGIEFYKLGWQGFEVGEVDNPELQVQEVDKKEGLEEPAVVEVEETEEKVTDESAVSEPEAKQ